MSSISVSMLTPLKSNER